MKNIDTVEIKVVNRQTIDRDTDIIEEIGSGTCRVKNGKHYIMYSVKGHEAECRVTIIADSGSVRIRRSGSVESDMNYIAGKKTPLRYNTQYGVIDMEIDTIRIHNALNENGGMLRLVYTITMQGSKTYNDTEIVVKQ